MRRDSEERPPPPWEGHPYLAVAVVLVALFAYSRYGQHLPVPGAFGRIDKRSGQAVFNEWILLASVVTSFYFVFGIAGRFAFSMASFMGLGAYVSHYVTRGSDLNPFVGLVAAAGVAAIVAFGFALVLRRAQHFYFAVATLGLAEVMLLVFRRFERLTGRSSGDITGVKDFSIFGWVVDDRVRDLWLLLAFLGLVLLLAVLLRRSPLQRSAIAARDNPTVTETLGYDAAWPGVVLFTLGSALAAVGGSLFVHTRGIGTPDTFGIQLGIGVFVALILGGLHSMWGGLIGTWFYVYVPLYLERWENWTPVIWGAVLVVVMIGFPEGLVGLASRLRSLRNRRTARPTPVPGESPS